MEITESLRGIGLTSSEIKVYLALLKLEFSSKGGILKESKTAPSKIYHVLDKLIRKGLVSEIKKNNIKHFSPAPLSKIKDYLKEKKEEIEKQEEELENITKELEKISKHSKNKTHTEVFFGWKGMETVYSAVLGNLKKGEQAYIIGASKGENPEKNIEFFIKYGKEAISKGVGINIIFNENARQYAKYIEKEANVKYKKRFLDIDTPAEIVITKGILGIAIMKEEPIIILIKDKETSESFKQYFNSLWKISKR